MKIKWQIILVLAFLFAPSIKPQTGLSKAELIKQISGHLPDSTRIDCYNELSWPIYSFSHPDSAIIFSNQAIDLAQKIGDLKRLSIAHRRLGIAYINTGEFKNSIFEQEKSLELSKKIKFTEGMIKALNNLGVIYLNNDLLDRALTYFLRSLTLVEQSKDFTILSSLYNNCGLIYMRTGDYARAKIYFKKALQVPIIVNNPDLVIEFNCHLSAVYRNLNQFDSTLYFLEQAKQLYTKAGNSKSKYAFLTSEGLYYSSLDQHERALKAFLNAQEVCSNESDKVTVLINIGEEYQKLGRMDAAIKAFQDAYQLSSENRTYNNLMYLTYKLAKIYQSKGNTKLYSSFIDLHLNYRDSSDKYIKVQHIKQQQLEFDFERKQVADSLKFVQKEQLKNVELEVANANLNREKTFKLMLIMMLVLVLIFSAFIYNRFFVIRRQNKIIEEQKQLVELKNHEIMDSINYAKRLQSAILPQKEKILQKLKLEILYLPKDIIGGDFYFFETFEDKIIFAICDCTGHGIPGAIMSVVCYQALQKSIKEYKLLDPAAILNKSRELIIDQLNASQQNIKDGMDCSLLVVDYKNKNIQWAGANNPLWYWQNEKLSSIKADKQPVAMFENHKEFTSHGLTWVEGTRFCLFTDGFADQFGGPNGKKFKQKQMLDLLLLNQHLSVTEQINDLEQKFLSWKGKLDQVDDVAVAIITL